MASVLTRSRETRIARPAQEGGRLIFLWYHAHQAPDPFPQFCQAAPFPGPETSPGIVPVSFQDPGTWMGTIPSDGWVSAFSRSGTNCQIPFRQIWPRDSLRTSRGSFPAGL